MFRFASSVLALLLLLLVGAWPAAAQYPERPLTILSGYPAGGMVDIVARALGATTVKNEIVVDPPAEARQKVGRSR